jgi:hypothetical protein
MFKGHKILLLLLLLVILIPSLAQAGLLEGGALSTLSVVDNAMAKFLYFAVYLIGYLAAIVFMIAGFLIQVGLELNANLINSPLVQVGWQISRDFANLLLVVAIITAAIGTIIRLQGYTYKNLLPKIIIVALLINFSLSIAGVFIDATGVVSNFFVTKSTPNASHGDFGEFSKSLAHALGLQEAMKTDTLEDEEDKFTESADFQFGKASLQLLAALFFVVAFTVLGGGTMMILSLSVLVRYIALSLLLIMLPLALISSAIPKFKKNWEEWQGKFIEYLAFLPVSLFFIYLTIIFLTNFKTHPSGVFGVISGSGGNVSDFIANIAETGARLSIVIGLLLGNLIISKKISSSAKDMVGNSSLALFNKFKSGSKKAGILPFRGAKAGARGIGRRIPATNIRGKAVGAISRLTSRIPVIGGALSSYRANRSAQNEELRAEQVNDYQKSKLKNLSNNELFGYSELGSVAKAAKLNELSKRGKLDEYLSKSKDSEAALKPFIDAAKKMNTQKDLLKTRPDLAGSFAEAGDDVAKAIEKAVSKISPKDSLEIATSALKKVEVATSLKMNQLKEIARSATPEKKQVLQSAVRIHLDPLILKDTSAMSGVEKQIFEKLSKIDAFMEGPAWS